MLYSFSSRNSSNSLRVLQMKVIAQEAVMSNENIGPVLGQHGLNAIKFCNEFNNRSFFFPKGVKLIVYLYYDVLKKTGEYYFIILGPELNYLYFNSFFEVHKVDLLYFVKSIMLKKRVFLHYYLQFNDFGFLFFKSMLLSKSYGVQLKEYI